MDDNGTIEALNFDDLTPDEQAAYHLRVAYDTMKANKPTSHMPIDRHWAIALTELEKVLAYFDYWVFRYTPDE